MATRITVARRSYLSSNKNACLVPQTLKRLDPLRTPVSLLPAAFATCPPRVRTVYTKVTYVYPEAWTSREEENRPVHSRSYRFPSDHHFTTFTVRLFYFRIFLFFLVRYTCSLRFTDIDTETELRFKATFSHHTLNQRTWETI